jgi:hypothetical protein
MANPFLSQRSLIIPRCRDSILYRLVEAYFMAHDHWASQCNITIMYPGHFPALARCIPALALSLHSCASLCFTTHLRVSPCIFAFHHASSRFTAHLRVPSRIFVHLRVSSRFSAHHRRSIHPLSSQFLGALHSIYYYIWLCLVSYNYYFVMDPYFTSLTYLECSWFASKPWEGAYVRLRVAMSVFTTKLLAVTIYHQLVPRSACICHCSP